MEDELLEVLKEWLYNWRSANSVPDGELLSGELLEKFIGEFQAKILTESGGFGPAVKGFEDAKLVLYSGVDWNLVGEFCEQSGGKYYMINQTKASMLWDRKFRQAVADVIGEESYKSGISARVLEGKVYEDGAEYGTRVGRYATDSDRFLALDDFLSSELAREGASRGDITYFLSPDARPETVGLSSEVPEVFTQKYVKGSGGLADFTVAYDLTKNADGSFSFKTADVSDAFVYFDKSGRVGFVDLTPSVGGESGVAADGSLKIGGSDVKGKVSFSDVKAAFRDSVMFFDEFGVFKGQDFRGTKLEGLVSSDVPERFAYRMSGESYVEAGSKLSSEQVRQALKDSVVFLDEAGGVISRGFEGTVLDGVAESAVPGEYAHCVSGEVYERMPSEAQMSAKYGEAFDSLSARGRLYAREAEVAGRFAFQAPVKGDPVYDVWQRLRSNYAKSVSKSVEQLSLGEEAAVNSCARVFHDFSSNASRVVSAPVSAARVRVAEWAGSSAGKAFLSAAGKLAGWGSAAVGIWYFCEELRESIVRANQVWKEGGRFEAGGIVLGRLADLAYTFGLDMAAVGVCAAAGGLLAGPVGAFVGSALGLLWSWRTGEVRAAAGSEIEQMCVKAGMVWDALTGHYAPRSLYVVGTDDSEILNGGSENDRIEGKAGNDLIFCGSGDDTVYAGDDNDVVHGGAGNDVISGDLGNDFLYGDEGDDHLDAGHGNDMLVGGAGNDSLLGGYGDDLYIFSLGDGNDMIADFDGVDVIRFKSGVSASSTVMERLGSDLLIQYSDKDTILVKNAYAFDDGRRFIERVRFDDGTVWNLDDIVQRVKIRRGTDRNDNMSEYSSSKYYSGNEEFYAGAGDDIVDAGDGDDIVFGEAGNDSLSGGNGNDMLVGGRGDDYLSGGSGDDTYVFNLGDGNDRIHEGSVDDRIVFGQGVTPDSLLFRRVNNDLVIRYGSAGDSVRIQNAYWYSDGRFFVENIEFADGTVWGLDEIVRRVFLRRGTDGNDNMTVFSSSAVYSGNEEFYAGAGDDIVDADNGDDIVFGEAGNDSLSGGNGNDMLVGGRGDDYLSGGSGDDTYVFNIGDGNDRIHEGSVDDRIVFGQGVTPDSLLFRRENNDLVIRYGSAGDSVRIQNAYWYSDGRFFVENIEFADGTKYEIDYENLCLKAAAVKQTGVAGAAEIKPAAAGCAACFDAAGFIAGVEEYAAAKNLPWVSGSAGYPGKTAADSGLSDSGQDYSVLSESSGCGSAVCNSGSAVEAGINNFTDLIIQDMCELAAGSACASVSAAAAPAAQSAPAQLWTC